MAGTARISDNFVAAWRVYRGLTQDALAELSDLAKPTISRIETGAGHYSQASLEQLATALRVTPAELLGRDPTDPHSVWASALLLTQMHDERRSLATAMLKHLADYESSMSARPKPPGAPGGERLEFVFSEDEGAPEQPSSRARTKGSKKPASRASRATRR